MDFKVAAGGPCLDLPSPSPKPCPDIFANGDVDGVNGLTILDLDSIANFLVEALDFDECQLFIADGRLSK